MRSILLFIRLSRPVFLLGAMLLYALGVGIAQFLGERIDWGLYITGQLWALNLQLTTHYLNEYYNFIEDKNNVNRTPFSGGSGALGTGKLQPRVALIASMTTIAILAFLTFFLISNYSVDPLVFIIMALAFIGAFFYSVPPIRLERSGYGELTTSILVAFLLPSFAYALQVGELNRLVAMSVVPLTLLHLGMMIALELPDYLVDMQSNKRNILVRLGWQRGITIQIIFVGSAYLVLLFSMFLGFPNSVGWHAMISLPVAALQEWQIIRIVRGAKPNWRILTLASVATFGTMAYFITFAYWIY